MNFFADKMVLIWTNPIGLCLFLHLLVGLKSQIQFKTKFNSVPIKEPKKISSSTLSFLDQASQFRSVFFKKRKPKLSPFKSAKFPFGEELSTVAGKQEIPSSVTERKHNEVSDILANETSTEATVRVAESIHDEEDKSPNSYELDSESATEIIFDGSVKTADLPVTSSTVKASRGFLNEKHRNLFQRPRSSLLASSRGKKKKDPFLDKVNKSPDVKFSNNEVTSTEESSNESFNVTDFYGSTTEIKAKPLNENLEHSQRPKASLSIGKTDRVSTASSFMKSSDPPSRATLVQKVSNSVEEEFILEMMKDVFLDTLKQAEANSRQDLG